MRNPLRTKAQPMAQTSMSASMPAPLLGLNSKDSLANMKEGYALILNNWYPKTSYLEVRGGAVNHLTGITGTPKTLAVYNRLNGTSAMYAVTSAGVFDATTAGAVGVSLAARTNGKHQWLNYGDGTNNYLMMFNGVDKPLYFEGTTWTAVDNATSPALTGLTTTKITSAFMSKGRLFFIEKDSLSFWYLAAGVVGGALTEYPLDGLMSKGGYLMAGANWTFDGGDGLDDAIVLVSSEGEVIVFKGTNPASATAWSIVGRYDLGRPLGQRCFQKFGGDLLLITESGVYPLSKSLQSTAINKEIALTNIIEESITDAGRLYGANFGWEITLYPAQSALILNIPIVEDGRHEQYVMNTITKAWCKFTDWDAETFVEFNGELYYATSTKVIKAWSGVSDLGNDIVAYGKTSFSYFRTPGVQKRFVMYRPVMNVNGSLTFLTGIDIDYKDSTISDTATYSVTTGAVWDTALWDASYWAAGLEIIRRWTSPSQDVGYCAAAKIKVNTNMLTVQWISNDIVWQTGNIM
jgi:hypothetical protein